MQITKSSEVIVSLYFTKRYTYRKVLKYVTINSDSSASGSSKWKSAYEDNDLEQDLRKPVES